jgi:hypothetical protein
MGGICGALMYCGLIDLNCSGDATAIMRPSDGKAQIELVPSTCTMSWAPAGGAAAAAPEGVRSLARRHLPLPPRGGRR